jgi:hypothetical protein
VQDLVQGCKEGGGIGGEGAVGPRW